MELQKTIALFLLLCYLISITVFVASTETCFTPACSKDEPVIRFPFHLRNYQSLFCGYPGFSLFCDASNRTIIRLPGEFTVQAINYSAQELWLNDPNDCLPQLLMNLNLSASPFSGVYYQDFTLFNCSFDSTTVKKLNPIAFVKMIVVESVRSLNINLLSFIFQFSSLSLSVFPFPNQKINQHYFSWSYWLVLPGKRAYQLCMYGINGGISYFKLNKQTTYQNFISF